MPLANALIDPAELSTSEPCYPLRVRICEECGLVQADAVEMPEKIFGNYAYFSSYSASWLEHARRYADWACERLHLGSGSQVIEVASNDGYLLQFFRGRGYETLGIEPAANVAAIARERGIPTLVEFMSRKLAGSLAAEGVCADLLIANNVLAHVPDLDDFVGGMAKLLKPEGLLTVEFPHLLRLVAETQFDTIYHEHFSYLSLRVIERVFAANDLCVFDVARLGTHGGSLRVSAQRGGGTRLLQSGVAEVRAAEATAGLSDMGTYRDFPQRVRGIRDELLGFLHSARSAGELVVAYGAAAKGNTLLNYCGIGPELIPFVSDTSPHKQGRLCPGSRIPIKGPEAITVTRPDYVLILPWNIWDEIVEQLAQVRSWGGRFVAAIPRLKVSS